MSKIWSILIVISILFSMLSGKPDQIIGQITKASMSATENVITFAGMICFWTGMFNILKNTKAIEKISTIFRPIIRILFKKEEVNDKAMEDIAFNITSNVVGVGNAATAFSVKAMEEMQKENKNKSVTNDSMSTFVLINTASLQLIPTSIISLRMLYGSNNANSIIVPIWTVSVISFLVGLISIKFLNKVVK